MSSQRNEAQGYALALNCLKKKEFSKGIQHALQYAGYRPRDFRIHELLGELYEGEKDWKKAIDSYRKALQADPLKSKLGLKVVDLYCRIPDELERLKHWTNQVGQKYPDEPVIHRAWEIIYKSSNQLNKFADYIKRNMQKDPYSVHFNIKLLECLQGQKTMWTEALDQCDRILDVLHWNEDALQCVVSFNEKLLSGGSYRQLTSDIIVRSSVNLLVALCYLTQVQLTNSGRDLNYCTDVLARLGKKSIELEPKLKNLDGIFKYPCQDLYLSEIKGQFHYLMGTFLLHLGLAGSLSQAEVLDMTTALYAQSLHEEAKRRNDLINMGWTPVHARIVARLSCNRLGQIWHFLHNITLSRGDEYLQQIQRKWCNTEGHKAILNQAFGTGQDLHFLRVPSFLFTSEPYLWSKTQLEELLTSIFEANCESVSSDPENFQLLIWTCLQWDTRADNIPSDFGHFVEETFGKLAFSTNKLKIMTIDNLRMLDLEAFLYAVVIVIRATLASQQMQGGGILDLTKKNLPILTLKHKLGTQELEEWFQAVFKLCHSRVAARDYPKLRVRVQKGLEVLRCGANHGTETQLLIQLGRTMNERMMELKTANGPDDRCRAYQAVSALYWTEALNHLKRLANDGAVPKIPGTFFPHVHKEFQKSDLKQYIDEGSVVLAEYYAQNGDMTKALQFLDEVKSPEGQFVKAHMYKQLSDEQTASDMEYQLTPTRLTTKGQLLDKAKYAVFATMDGISESANHPLHEKVKNLLAEIEEEQGMLARKIAEIDGSPPPPANDSSIYHSMTGDTSFTEQTQNDPSPQRLASEIRSLNLSHIHMEREREETKKMLELQNKTLDQNQTMMEQQSRLVEHILNLKAQSIGSAAVPQAYGDSDVLRKISQQNENLLDVMNSMKNEFHELKRDVGDLRERMTKMELEQERGKVRELEKQVAAAGKSTQTPTSVASPAPPSMMAGPSVMTGHKPLYQQQMLHPSSITYIPHPHLPGYVVPVESTYHAGMMTSTPAVRRSGTPQTILSGFAGPYDNGSSPTEEEEELKQQFGKGGLGLQPGESREYVDPSVSSLLSSNQFTQMKLPPTGTSMRSGASQSWQSPSGASILSGVPHQPAASPKTLGMQGQRMDGSPSLAAYTAAAAQRQQQPSLMGNQPGSNLLTVPRPIVTSVSTAKPSSHLIKSPTPASQSVVSHLASTKPTVTSQSPFAGFSFNKTPSTLSSFASSQAFQIPKSTTPVTTTSAVSSPFAGFSFQTTPAKKDSTPSLFGFSSSSQPSKSSSAAQQYPQLTALLSGGPKEGDEENAESPRPGFYAASQSSETPQRKPGQSPMGVTSTTPQLKEEKPSATSVKGNNDNDEDVIFMGEYKATPEQVAKAEKLLLSPSFYLYEERPPCPGCRGCDEEDLKAKKEGDKPAAAVEQKSSPISSEKPKVSEPSSQPSFFANAAVSSLSFASLSADGDAGFLKKDTSNKPFQFAGAGAPVFGSSQQDDDNVADDQEYDPHYDPIISLPENVDLTTGDEGEDIVYKERAKLYRYDSDTQQWKERGVGDMKILKNPETGRTRILMRREQVLKVCANHWLTPSLELLPMSSSDRAWVWRAVDFAEGEECHEQFAIKFKTPDLAAEFKKTFDKMKEEAGPSFAEPLKSVKEKSAELDKEKPVEPAKEKPAESAKEKPAESVKETPPTTKEDESGHRFHQADPVIVHPQEEEAEEEDIYGGEADGYEDEEDYYDDEDDDDDDEYEDYDDDDEEEEEEEEEDGEHPGNEYSEEPTLADRFKPAPGSWDCDSCMINNPADKFECVACSTPKPGTSKPTEGTPASSSSSQGAPGGMGMTGGSFSLGNFKFSGFSSNPSAFSAGSGFGGFKTTPGTFSFGQTPSQPSNPTPSSSAGFSVPPGGFSFTQPKTETSQPTDSGAFKMSAASFSFAAPTPASSRSTKPAADSTTTESPLSKPGEAAPTPQTMTTPKFDFGSGMPQFTFGGTNQQKPNSGFSFASPSGNSVPASLAASTPSSSSSTQAGSVFGTTQAPPIFGATPEKGSTSAFKDLVFGTKPSEQKTEGKETISFSDLVKNQGQFSFRLDVDNVASSPPKSGSKSPVKSPGLNKSGEYYQEEERDDIYFEPVVTLPENYKLETGEENEDVKFSQRAKLFRFDVEGSQWKERGVGDIKVLYNPETKMHRIVMRRDQVLKVCANHYITQYVDLQPNRGSERSWVWQAMDSSDGEPQNEQLAVRFKTEDTAREFKEVVDEAKKNLPETSEKLTADSAEEQKNT